MAYSRYLKHRITYRGVTRVVEKGVGNDSEPQPMTISAQGVRSPTPGPNPEPHRLYEVAVKIYPGIMACDVACARVYEIVETHDPMATMRDRVITLKIPGRGVSVLAREMHEYGSLGHPKLVA